MAYMTKEYDQILKEHFDLDDKDTRTIMLNVNEEDQSQILASLTSRLYDHIINKIDDIDFGDIPETKGDITKLSNYEQLVDSLDVMKSLLSQYGQKANPVDTVLEALDNIRSRREMFEKAFKLSIELPMVMYSTMTLAVIQANSYLISTCVEFIKIPNGDSYEAVVDKIAVNKTKDNLVLNNLAKFNQCCKKGDFDKSMGYVISQASKNLLGVSTSVAGVAAVVALTLLATNILPIMRELVYFFFHTRTQVSDYFYIQSELLKINAQAVETNPGMKAKERKEISKKQYAIANFFDKVANKIAIDNKQSEVKASREVKSDNTKKYKADDLVDSMPDSVASSIF